MATRLNKLLWSILCGTALGLGTAACYDSEGPKDARADTDEDVEDVVEDAEPEIMPAYGVPEYGPPWP
jgi:hypothetical protein